MGKRKGTADRLVLGISGERPDEGGAAPALLRSRRTDCRWWRSQGTFSGRTRVQLGGFHGSHPSQSQPGQHHVASDRRVVLFQVLSILPGPVAIAFAGAGRGRGARVDEAGGRPRPRGRAPPLPPCCGSLCTGRRPAGLPGMMGGLSRPTLLEALGSAATLEAARTLARRYGEDAIPSGPADPGGRSSEGPSRTGARTGDPGRPVGPPAGGPTRWLACCSVRSRSRIRTSRSA